MSLMQPKCALATNALANVCCPVQLYKILLTYIKVSRKYNSIPTLSLKKTLDPHV